MVVFLDGLNGDAPYLELALLLMLLSTIPMTDETKLCVAFFFWSHGDWMNARLWTWRLPKYNLMTCSSSPQRPQTRPCALFTRWTWKRLCSLWQTLTMSPISSRKDSAIAARKSPSLHLSADYSVCYLGGPQWARPVAASRIFRT